MPCSRTQQANLPACSPQPPLNAERQAGKLRMPFFKVFWYDSTRGMNPRSTDCEADALTTTPSRRFPSRRCWFSRLSLLLPSGTCANSKKKCYVFSAHNIFTIWCALFVIEFLILKSWLCLRSTCMCSVHCLCEPKGVLRFSEIGSWEHISNIKLF